MKEHRNIFAHTDCVSEGTLSKYISGKLSPAEKHEVEKHLIDCEMCSDAVEGLNIRSGNNISAITSELNEKIQTRISRIDSKKEVKVIFLRQYRTQLAIAASIVLVLGLVWFFRSAVSLNELDSAQTQQIFADKFEPPPAEKSEEQPNAVNFSGNERTDADGKLTPAAQEPRDVLTENKNISDDNIPENSLELTTVAEKLVQEDITLPEKETENYQKNKSAETSKENVETKAELKFRDAENAKGEISTVTVTKEAQKKELEKTKSDESKKTGRAEYGQLPKSEVTTASGTASAPAPSEDKSRTLAKNQQLKQTDVREEANGKDVKRAQTDEEGDMLALESGKKGKDEPSAKKKSKAPQKAAGESYDFKSTTIFNTSTAPQTQNEITLTDSTAAFMTFGTSVSASDITGADSAMMKYDKKDYAGAVVEFEKTLKQNPNDEKALFYSAVSYLSLGQADKALAYFNKIMANKSSKYYDDAQWYSSLAYIKNNDLKNARTNLQLIQNNEKSRYRKQADETLQQIK